MKSKDSKHRWDKTSLNYLKHLKYYFLKCQHLHLQMLRCFKFRWTMNPPKWQQWVMVELTVELRVELEGELLAELMVVVELMAGHIMVMVRPTMETRITVVNKVSGQEDQPKDQEEKARMKFSSARSLPSVTPNHKEVFWEATEIVML